MNLRKNISKFYPVIIITAGLIISGLMITLKPVSIPDEVKFSSPFVETQEILSSPINIIIRSQGSIIPQTESQIFSEIIGPVIYVSSNLYEGSSFLSDEIYIYDISLLFDFNDGSNQAIFSDTFSTPIKPEIVDYTIPETFQINANSWSWLPIDIEILNLNGFDNIESVSYQVKRIYNGCDVECYYDLMCNDPIEDSEYQSDPTWIFEYVSSSNQNQNHSYHVEIPMRPLDGSALLDTDDNVIFPSSDCGRTGIVLFKFIVYDKDGLIDQVIDIPLEITE